MPSTLNILLAALAALLFWTLAGWPVARHLTSRSLALPIAPALGWALHSAAVLPILLLVGFSPASVAAVSGMVLIASVGALLTQRNRAAADGGRARVPAWAFAAAALLALAPAAAIVPKITVDGIALAAPIFDHSKVAIIDEMTRLGLPPGNPFFGEAGAPSRLAYYYLWHFSAAELALLMGVSGWEADIAMTWFTAFASLTLMIGFAVQLSGAPAGALWVLLLSLAASLRLVIAALLGTELMDGLIVPASGFGGWLSQSAWAPQHIASASCVALGIFFLAKLARRPGLLLLATLALLFAAAYESSSWIGAVALPLAALAAGLVLLSQIEPQRRLQFLTWSAAAAVLAIGLAAPMLYDQWLATAARNEGSPIALHAYEVLGELFPQPLRRVLDLPAFWLVLLVVELPAIAVTGAIGLWMLLRSSREPEQRTTVLAFTALAGTCLAVAWLLRSTVGDNNDLGWRAVLPAVMVLTIGAAVAVVRWLATGARLAATAAIAVMLLGLAEAVTFVRSNLIGTPTPAGKTFAETPALWEAVRRHSAPDERVANNPLFLERLTPWPINLSWALLANRRSCYAGRDFAIPFTALPRARREAIDVQFIRVFDGEATPDDVRDFAQRYQCGIVVVTADDKAWARDPFAASALYRLVDAREGRWRIYKAMAP